jgi:4-hydroxy-tetrahydrodipicolinate reductase
VNVTIPVVIMGLGEIGQMIARAALSISDLEIVGAIDLNPERVGRSLGDLLHAVTPEVTIVNTTEEAFRAAKGGVLLHSTGSRLEAVAVEIEGALRAGLSVVSTCEELACPWVRHPKIADQLERLAQKRNVTVLGAGVNPGFVLDRLIATLGQVVGRVERVHGVRVVDATRRRDGLKRKIGAGLTEAEFNAGVENGSVGHVGLMESAALAAMGLGHSVDEVDEEILPVIAETAHDGLWRRIEKGDICGLRQIARAFDEGREVARLELTIALGAKDPRDEITIVGEPPISLKIPGGTPGDEATAWSVVHAAALLGQGAEPGLITVLDLPAGR